MKEVSLEIRIFLLEKDTGVGHKITQLQDPSELNSPMGSQFRFEDKLKKKFQINYRIFVSFNPTGGFTINDTKSLSNNYYSKALYELKEVPYYH